MDLIRTTDHIQNRPGFADHNTAPGDSNKPLTHLSEVKGSARPRGRANASPVTGQYAPNKPQSTDTPPSSLIARMTRGVLANQRRQLESLPSSSRDTRMAEHYKASYVLQDRGGATAPGAKLSLRPTGKAAGGMENPGNMTKQQLRDALSNARQNIRGAEQQYQVHRQLAASTTDNDERQQYLNLADSFHAAKLTAQEHYDAIFRELESRSGRHSR